MSANLFHSYLSPVEPGFGQVPSVTWGSSPIGYASQPAPAFDNASASTSMRPGGVGSSYQAQQAPTMLRPKAPSSQGPFQFTASSPFNFSARPVLESLPEGAATPPGMPGGLGAAYAHASMPAPTPAANAAGAPMLPVQEQRAMSLPANTKVQTRAEFRDAACEHAFRFVDANKIGNLNMSQNKTGLTLVFEQLGDVKMPKDTWYVEVFRNFDPKGMGFVGFSAFRDIAVQFDDHQLARKKKMEDKMESQAGTPSGTPAASRNSAKPLPQPPPQAEGMRPAGQTSAATPGGRTPGQRVDPFTAAAAAASVEGGSPGERSSADSPDQAGAIRQERSRVSSDMLIPHGPSRSSCGAGRQGAAELDRDVMFPTYVGRLAIFDDYEFHGDAGKGAFGKVMVVRNKATKQLRACKVMGSQSAQQRDLIDTEITILKEMNHPNIVKLYEVYFEEGKEKKVTNGNIYLIFELCEGGDLFGRILHHYERLHQPMTEGHVAFMMSQIMSAIAYLHDMKIVHRDIKPENILFVDRSSSSAIKIIDYGLADFTAKLQETAKEVRVEKKGMAGQFARMIPAINGKHFISHHERKKVMVRAGTPHYMAPEMLETQWYDQKADIFSIGIILCQLLTGWHPFHIPQVDDEASVKNKIKDPAPVEFPRDVFANVSPEAQHLCRMLLEKDPQKRWNAKQALESPWFQDPNKPTPYGDKGVLSNSIFEGLMQYQAHNKLKRAVLQLLTRELSEYQIQELRKKFNALDSQGDGMLSPQELIEGMRHIDYDMKDEELDKIMAALDVTGNQQIGYKEFISALIERRVKFDRSQLLAVFKRFDVKDRGLIAYEDVAKMLKTTSGEKAGITESEFVEIADPYTRSADTERVELTFDEFVQLFEAT